MYSNLNHNINELNSIRTNNIGDVNIARKIIPLLSQRKYGNIITILHNLEDFSQMFSTLVTRKIVAFKMSQKWFKRMPLHQRHMLLHVMKRRKVKVA
jgi:hypothetical protein